MRRWIALLLPVLVWGCSGAAESGSSTSASTGGVTAIGSASSATATSASSASGSATAASSGSHSSSSSSTSTHGASSGSSGSQSGVGSTGSGSSSSSASSTGTGGSSSSTGTTGSSGSTGGPITGRAFYIAPATASPPGSDLNPGTQSAPLLTFAHAFSLMHPGDGLVLEDGTYTRTPNGLPSVDCTNGALQGTASAQVTVMAEHERRALLQGDGHSSVFKLTHCNHWNIIGLHIEDADANFGQTFNTVDFEYDSHVWVRRNLLAHSNRCQNSHLMAFDYSNSYNLVEENEFYYFHRHPLIFFGNSDHNEARRNYVNARGYPAACNYITANSGGINYGGSDNLWENHISENTTGPDNETVGTCSWTATLSCSGGTPTQRDSWLGSISLNELQGGHSSAHTQAVSLDHITWQNHVVVHPKQTAMYLRSTDQSILDHVSVFAGPTTASLVVADQEYLDGGRLGSGSNSLIARDSVVVGRGSSIAFDVGDSTGGSWSWSLTALGAENVSVLSNKPVSQTIASPFGYGSCFLWAPDGSPVASSGAGARVLYAIEDGGQTSQRLWDVATGAPLFAGAIVPGLNEAGADGGSLIDIAGRLNINQNGCSFPAGY